jgi:septum formation protein
MINNHPIIYLASKSPRRKKLLKQMNLNFKVITVDIDESRKGKEPPLRMVKRLAEEKLESAKKIINEGIIITADTTVVLSGEILAKPENEDDAKRMLGRLSGKTHTVYTGFALYNSRTGRTIIDFEKTLVTFRKITGQEIDDYVKTGSPMDKAGAYGIQDDFGAVFVKKINGDYYNVVGLPVSKLYSNLLKVI